MISALTFLALLLGSSFVDVVSQPQQQPPFVPPPEPRPERNPGHRALQTTCFGSWEFWHDKGCSYNILLWVMTNKTATWGCGHDMKTELRLIFGVATDAEAEERVRDVCRTAQQDRYDNFFLPFSHISRENNNVWDKAFFDGGTLWNEATEIANTDGLVNYMFWTNPKPLIDAVSWTRATYNAGIQMPAIDNFENCELRTVMCCWVRDRQRDDHGSCDVSSCIDANPEDNTDVCYVDMSRSPTSNRVKAGFALFEMESEDDVNCQGFAWSNDDTDPTSFFRGSTMYHVGMQNLAGKGYAQNVPGAPMCACVEKMPTVTRADCKTLDLTKMWVGYKYTMGLGLEATASYSEVRFRDCTGVDPRDGTTPKTNDLASHYRKLVNDGHATMSEYNQLVNEFLVGDGQCQAATTNFLDSQWLLSRQPVHLTNDASGRMLYAAVGPSAQYNVGATSNLVGGANSDGQWGFRGVACPIQMTRRCYLIINYHSQTRLCAEVDMSGSNGIRTSAAAIRDDEKWMLMDTTCADGTVNLCYVIVNAISDRKLYAEAGYTGNNRFGADKGGDRPDMKWRVPGVSDLRSY